MQNVKETELRNVVGGASYTMYCCNYNGGEYKCKKKYKGGDWKKGKVTFSYANQITFGIKYALNRKHYYNCHEYDCDHQ